MNRVWPQVALGEVATPVERPEVPSAGTEYRQIGVRLWGEGAYERESIDGSQTKYKTLSRVEADDIIVNKIWARNGSVAVVPEALAGCFGSGEFPTFAPDKTKLFPRWIHWLTKTKGFWEQCDDKSRGTSGKNRIRPERFLEITIPLPPLDEQRRVVAQIEELAEKIEEARGLRRLAMEEAVFLSRSAVESVYQDLKGRFGLSTLADACTSITDGDHNTPSFSESGVRFIFVGNVSSGILHFNNSKRVSEDYFRSLKPHRLPERGDIIYSAVGATLGVPAVVDTDEPFCFQRHVAILKPNRKFVESHYIWHMLRSQTAFKKAWATTTGTAQPTVPLRAINEIPLPLPAISEQRRIVAYLDNLQAKIDSIKHIQSETAAELDSMLPSILDKAFKGDLTA